MPEILGIQILSTINIITLTGRSDPRSNISWSTETTECSFDYFVNELTKLLPISYLYVWGVWNKRQTWVIHLVLEQLKVSDLISVSNTSVSQREFHSNSYLRYVKEKIMLTLEVFIPVVWRSVKTHPSWRKFTPADLTILY